MKTNGLYKLIFLSLLFPFSISPAELLLKNGDAFLLDITQEDERNVNVNWKGKIYSIPKREIQNIDYARKSTGSSYKYSTFVLKDGSKIKGVLAESTDSTYTIRTDVGFLELDRSRIKETDYTDGKSPDLSHEYLSDKRKQPETIFGITGSILGNGPPLSNYHKVTGGGGFYLEPAFLNFWEKYQIGFKSEYLVSPGESTYRFFNNIVYLNRGFGSSESKNWYGNLGFGVGSVQYNLKSANVSGTDPLFYAELGYQGIKLENFTLRMGIRSTCYFESKGDFCMLGAEIALGYRM